MLACLIALVSAVKLPYQLLVKVLLEWDGYANLSAYVTIVTVFIFNSYHRPYCR